MLDKIGDIFFDVVKYVATGMFIYPLLEGVDRDWRYYTLVGAGMVLVSAVGVLFHYFHNKISKRNNNNNNSISNINQ